MTIQKSPGSQDSVRSHAAYVADMVDIVLLGENTYRVVESGVTLGFIEDRMGSYVGFAGEEFSDRREVCTSLSFDFCVGRIMGFA
jgi:hypothetical protein